uniref:Uncharacterized protein n=1 Tax=Romanomermis culicivorax TaxID=13658 RepID=A0A915IWQ1_ROMCU
MNLDDYYEDAWAELSEDRYSSNSNAVDLTVACQINIMEEIEVLHLEDNLEEEDKATALNALLESAG